MSTDTLPERSSAPRQFAIAKDNGQYSNLMDTERYEHALRVAGVFASSDLVPAHYRGKTANCFIGIQMAMRMGIDPIMLLQNTYIVHGKPGMFATLAIALVNTSGLFVDSLDYEIEGGTDPFHKDYRVRAFAKRKTSGKDVYGPWVDWKMVSAEKWNQKDGSKWLTIPGLMFQYRAGTFFARLHCPERLMGMQTVEEIEDVGPRIQVESHVVTSGIDKLRNTLSDNPDPSSSVAPDAPVTDSTGNAPTSPTSKAADQVHSNPERSEPGPTTAAGSSPSPAAGSGQAPASDGSEAQEDVPFKDFEGFVQAMEALADGRKVPRAKVAEVVNASLLALGKKGKEKSVKLPTLIGWYQQAVDGEGRWAVCGKKQEVAA